MTTIVLAASALYFLYSANVIIEHFYGRDPNMPTLEFADVLLTFVFGLACIFLTIPRRFLFGQPDIYSESTMAMFSFVFHASRFCISRIRARVPVAEAEKVLIVSLLGFFMFVHVTQTDSFVHHLSICWGISDFFRCGIAVFELTGNDIEKSRRLLPDVYGAFFFLPAIISVWCNQSIEPWVCAYVFVISAVVHPMVRLQLLRGAQGTPFEQPRYNPIQLGPIVQAMVENFKTTTHDYDVQYTGLMDAPAADTTKSPIPDNTSITEEYTSAEEEAEATEEEEEEKKPIVIPLPPPPPSPESPRVSSPPMLTATRSHSGDVVKSVATPVQEPPPPLSFSVIQGNSTLTPTNKTSASFEPKPPRRNKHHSKKTFS
jgi:hypothetical protein